VTKHSDYFVWKDTSERVARHCVDNVDKNRVNSCVLKHLFLEGVEQSKISPKPPGNALSNALLMSRLQNFELINSGPKILRSCFLHWQQVGYESVPGWCPHWRCRYRRDTYMCHKYHVKHTQTESALPRDNLRCRCRAPMVRRRECPSNGRGLGKRTRAM